MMYLQTRTAVPVLMGLAFGIFFTLSCATSEQTGQSTVQQTDELSFEQQLERLNREISENPGQTELRLQKTRLLAEHARTIQPVDQRKILYQNAADEVRTVEQQGAETAGFNEIIHKAWNHERSEAIRLLQEDRSETYDTHFEAIIAHFDNAIVLMPDSLVTYSLKATSQYRRGHINDAIDTLNDAKDAVSLANSDIDEKLAYLLLQAGNTQESVNQYEVLHQQYPQNQYYRHGLINAYILNGDHSNAVELLRNFVDEYPSRQHYKITLAQQLYQLFSQTAEEMISSGEPLHPGDIEHLRNLAGETDNLYKEIQAQVPANEETTHKMAAFYLNSSIKFKELQNLSGSDEIIEELEELYSEHLQRSLPHWERLTEINPDNMEFINGLYSVYINLGMTDEAESIERSLNF